MRRLTPPTRHTLQRNAASRMKDLILELKFFKKHQFFHSEMGSSGVS